MGKYEIKKGGNHYAYIEASDYSDAMQIVLDKEGFKLSLVVDKKPIYGIDVSHWQGDIDWSALKIDFAILKASQGTAMVDNKLEQNKFRARKQGILLGYYHYANGGDARKEAEHFVKSVGEILPGEFLVLDWEINHATPDAWCRAFLDRVFELTGIRPLFYTYEARIKSTNWDKVIAGNYGLWIAKYGKNDGTMGAQPFIGKWGFYVIWQYSSAGMLKGISGKVDLDYANITLDTLRKYGKKI